LRESTFLTAALLGPAAEGIDRLVGHFVAPVNGRATA